MAAGAGTQSLLRVMTDQQTHLRACRSRLCCLAGNMCAASVSACAHARQSSMTTTSGDGGEPKRASRAARCLSTSASANYCSSGKVPVQLTPMQICKRIIAEEGPKGFFRGVKQRVMLHTPAVAISWATYETVKRML